MKPFLSTKKLRSQWQSKVIDLVSPLAYESLNGGDVFGYNWWINTKHGPLKVCLHPNEDHLALYSQYQDPEQAPISRNVEKYTGKWNWHFSVPDHHKLKESEKFTYLDSSIARIKADILKVTE